jgi:uncharacterized protein involved in exopolysaccharide biosynthesis
MSTDRTAVTTTDQSSSPAFEGEVSPYALLRVILRRRAAVVTTAVVTAVVLVGLGLAGRRRYTVEASFIPQATSNRNAAGGLAALAGEFGVTLTAGEPGQSPAFYADLLRSRALLGRLLADTFDIPVGDGIERQTVADILNVRGSSEPRRRERTLRALPKAVTASITRETSVVHVRVTTRSPVASEAIAERLLELLNQFNLETRQTNAAAERQFVARRLAETETALLTAEDGLRAFLDANRQFTNSPQLQFERDRLQRQVSHQQALYTSLQESLESARIAEVRDTPLITVVQTPEVPVYPDSRRLLRRGVLGLILGLMLGILVALLREYMGHPLTRGDEELVKLRAEWARVWKPWSRRTESPSAG